MTDIQWTGEIITSLQPHEVFVFGSNATGFHGAGSAGQAFRGDHRNTWRGDKFFLRAMSLPPGTRGVWAQFGIARGYQEGVAGRSYAIQTIVKPGQRRSLPLSEIYVQLLELWQWAALNPHRTLLITPLAEGYSGYKYSEMLPLWQRLIQQQGLRHARFVGRATDIRTHS